MPGTTISSRTTLALTLATPDQAPVSITGQGTISVSGGFAARAIVAQPGVAPIILNDGLVEARNFSASIGIDLAAGGTIANDTTPGSAARIIAASYGILNRAAGPLTVQNAGTILATGQSGVAVKALGDATITNGAADGRAALLSGYSRAVEISGATARVTNFGTIRAAGIPQVAQYDTAHGTAIHLGAGGTVTNGSRAVRGATIAGGSTGVRIDGAPGTVVNFGTISGTAAPFIQRDPGGQQGVALNAGGSVVNGSNAARDAFIYGRNAAVSSDDAAATVRNFGTMYGLEYGVRLRAGGLVTNGSAADTAAVIKGTVGVLLAAGTLRNFGTVTSTYLPVYNTHNSVSFAGVVLGAGTVINGGPGNTGAVIEGRVGIAVNFAPGRILSSGPGTIRNFGTVTGRAGSGIGVYGAGATIVNGSESDTAALIRAAASTYFSNGISINAFATARITNFGGVFGRFGIFFADGAAGTVVNHGVIGSNDPAHAAAIRFAQGDDRVVVQPGAAFIGLVIGGAGTDTIELAQAPDFGFMHGIGTQFTGFEKLVVDPGGLWVLQGANTIPTVVNNWLLRLALNASLTVSNAIDPAGTGTFELLGGAKLELAAATGASQVIKFNADARLVVDHAAQFGAGIGSAGYAGPLLRNFGALATIELKDLLPGALTLDYTPATGLLELDSAGTPVAALRFETSTLGAGTFHLGQTADGHALLSHG